MSRSFVVAALPLCSPTAHMKKRLLLFLGDCVLALLALGAALPAQAAVITAYVNTTWYEPYCDVNSIFVGSFSYDTSTHAVTGLTGKLSEAMAGGVYNQATGPSASDGIAWLSLNHQLANGDSSHQYTWRADGGTFATVFKNTGSLTFYTGAGGDGWSPQAGVNAHGRYAGWPILANNAQNAYAIIFVPDSLTSANTTSNPISLAWDEGSGTGSRGLAGTAYADLTNNPDPGNWFGGGGMMGPAGMTATSASVYGDVGTMGGFPLSEEITVGAPTWLATPIWSAATSGSWTGVGNWSTVYVPNQPGLTAIVGTGTVNPIQVSLDGKQTLGSLIFANSASNTTGYSLSNGTLVLDNSRTDAQITVTGGSHSISASVTLNDNLVISPSAGTSLEIDGDVSESSPGKSLTLCGPGTLVLSGSNSYTGGTVVTEGTLEILTSTALASGTSLTVGAGGTLIFGAANSSTLPALSTPVTPFLTPSPVPEPGTFILLFIGGLLMFARWNRIHCNVVMVIMTFAGISLSGCNQPAGKVKDTPSDTTMTEVTRQFEVEGMHCDGCAQSITTALKAVPGVKSATVSFEAKKATVITEGEQPATSDIEKTISDMGFRPRLLAPSNEAPATSKP